MRCIALGQAWQDAGEQKSEIRERPPVLFICAGIPETLAELIQSEGFGLIRIEAEPGTPEDIRQTLEVLSGFRSHPSSFSPWLVLDGYHFDLEYQRAVRKAGCKLLLIDDYNHQAEYECDILLNQNINAFDLNYKINPDARLLLGTGYSLLRREFRALEQKGRVCPSIGKNILVTLGGADPDNVTLKVIEALRLINRSDLHAEIVVGPANPHLNSLRQAVAASAVSCELISAVRDMSGLMRRADLAVSAGGSTCWELCCLGVPFMTLVLAENQRGLAEGLNRRGIAGNAGEGAQIGSQEIAARLTALLDDPAERELMSIAGRALIDGFGVHRVLCRPAKDAGLDLFAGRLTLRCAGEHDLERLWLWANDPAVRANSYQPEPIPFAEHQKWFKKKLGTPDSLILILELDGTAAGQVRYDRVDQEAAEIDFSIDAKFRGLGLGDRLIKLSLDKAAKRLGVRTLRALVMERNKPSSRVFETAGFEQQGFEMRAGVRSVRFEKGFIITSGE